MELALVAEASETATQDLAENDFVNLMFLKLYYTHRQSIIDWQRY